MTSTRPRTYSIGTCEDVVSVAGLNRDGDRAPDDSTPTSGREWQLLLCQHRHLLGLREMALTVADIPARYRLNRAILALEGRLVQAAMTSSTPTSPSATSPASSSAAKA